MAEHENAERENAEHAEHENTAPALPVPRLLHDPLQRGARGDASTRALVLGGGGSTGNAWLIGVVAGLFDTGVDLTRADLIIGTSAGATAAAQLTSANPAELLAGALAGAPPLRTGPPRSDGGSGPAGPVADHLERMARIIAAAADAADMRRRMGAVALELAAASDGSGTARWRATVAARLPGGHWPDRAVQITAVEAETGEPVVFDGSSGVDLVDAVAASTSGGPAYRIGDRWYVDGGYRSVENADLAAGHGRVLVLAPLGGRSLHPREWGTRLSAQVEALRAGGSAVRTVVPGEGSGHLFGADAMDASLRPAAARAGHDRGRALAEQLSVFWR